jgi:TonB-dependent Receptor Plug Domain/Carboxypeptidase regulatory-like domain
MYLRVLTGIRQQIVSTQWMLTASIGCFFVCHALAQPDILRKSINLDCDQCTPQRVLVKLSEAAGTDLSLDPALFEGCPKIKIHARGETVKDILERAIECNWKIEYQVREGAIVLYRTTRRFTIRGHVRDAVDGEVLAGVSIKINQYTTTTNEFGAYSIEVPADDYQIQPMLLGYERPSSVAVRLSTDRVVNMRLIAMMLPEVTVTSATLSPQSGQRQFHGYTILSKERITRMSPTAGQPDLMRMIAELPGIQTGADGLGGIHIRGGNADANLVLLDDAPVYNPGHLLGLFSIFNPATIQRARLWKGDFPARYGGRTASVLDVRLRDGNSERHQVAGGVGLFASDMLIEGPFAKKQGSYLLAGRFTYFEPWIEWLRNQPNLLIINNNKPSYKYLDINAKLNFRIGPHDVLYASLYTGGDRFDNPYERARNVPTGRYDDTYLLNSDWGNRIGALRWNHTFRKGLFANTTLRYSSFDYISDLGFRSKYTAQDGRESVVADYAQYYRTIISDMSAKSDFTWQHSSNLTLRWGGAVTRHNFQPGAISVNFTEPAVTQLQRDSLQAILANSERRIHYELESYVDVTWRLDQHWTVEAGINNAWFSYTDPVGQTRFYPLVLPRLHLHHQGRNGWYQWAFAGKSGQFIHQIGSFNLSLPFELWIPSTAKIKPEYGWQTNGGIGWSHLGWSAQAEAYYKAQTGLLVLRSSNEVLVAGGAEDASGWEDRTSVGTGMSKGLELSLSKTTQDWNIGVAYTLSRTTRQFEDINRGQPFLFRFDRTHDIKLHGSARLFRQFYVDASWAYATGNPITLAGIKYNHQSPGQGTGREVIYYTGVNAYRLPAYHRLDLTVSFQASGKRFGDQHRWVAGAYNIYNRANPFFILLDAGSGVKGKAVQYTLLPLLPIVRYEFKF